MGLAPCIKDGFIPRSSPPDQGEIREREQTAEAFSAGCCALIKRFGRRANGGFLSAGYPGNAL
jgi:hypothetical protein